MAATVSPRVHPVVLICALVLSISACKKDQAKPAEAEAALAVSAMPVVSRDIARGITVSGPVSAVEEMQLGVETNGLRVTALNVDVGQHVHRGQVLLSIDHRTLDADMAQANAALKEAEAGAELARANLKRGENLADGKFISATQLDELRANRTAAEARLGTARAARDAAALRRSFADLRAPADGIISKRLVQPGQVVGAGQELMRLIKGGRLEWRAELPPEQLSQVKPGDRIELRTRDGKAVEGTVRAVSPGVDSATRTGTVYADLPAPGGLQPGTYLEGRIATGLGKALVVPASAVVLRDGFPTVFTVDAQHVAHQARIEQGLTDQGMIEVRSGLTPGAQVVSEGAGFLGDGDKVRLVPSTQTAAATVGASNTASGATEGAAR